MQNFNAITNSFAYYKHRNAAVEKIIAYARIQQKCINSILFSLTIYDVCKVKYCIIIVIYEV